MGIEFFIFNFIPSYYSFNFIIYFNLCTIILDIKKYFNIRVIEC
jgi:hypothetical protein